MAQCAVHPQTEAVDYCVSCGRGLCETCRVRIKDAPHCKECVEAGLIKGGAPQAAPGPPPPAAPMMAPQWVDPGSMFIPPTPEGPADMSLFRKGATGAMVAAVACVLIGVYSILGISRIFRPDWIGLVMLGHLPFFMLWPAFQGIQRNYGVQGAEGKFMVLAGVLGISLLLWAVVLLSTSGSSFSNNFTVLMALPVPIILGIGFLVAHSALTAAAMRIPPMSESRALMRRAGELMMYGGVAFLTVMGLLVAAWIILAISLFCLSNALAKAPDPGLPPPAPHPPGLMPPLR